MHAEHSEIQEYRNRLKRADEEDRIEIYREVGYLAIPDVNILLMEGLSDPSPRAR